MSDLRDLVVALKNRHAAAGGPSYTAAHYNDILKLIDEQPEASAPPDESKDWKDGINDHARGLSVENPTPISPTAWVKESEHIYGADGQLWRVLQLLTNGDISRGKAQEMLEFITAREGRGAMEAPAPPAESDVIEALAAYAHEAWSSWMRYLFEKCAVGYNDTQVIPEWAVERWSQQMHTQYEDLPESEKKSDRVEAWKMLALMPVVFPPAEMAYVSFTEVEIGQHNKHFAAEAIRAWAQPLLDDPHRRRTIGGDFKGRAYEEALAHADELEAKSEAITQADCDVLTGVEEPTPTSHTSGDMSPPAVRLESEAEPRSTLTTINEALADVGGAHVAIRCLADAIDQIVKERKMHDHSGLQEQIESLPASAAFESLQEQINALQAKHEEHRHPAPLPANPTVPVTGPPE